MRKNKKETLSHSEIPEKNRNFKRKTQEAIHVKS